MSTSQCDEGSDSDHVTGQNLDNWFAGHRRIPAWQRARLTRYRREWAVEVRPFTAIKRLLVSEAQGLSGEAVKGNPDAYGNPQESMRASLVLDQPKT